MSNVTALPGLSNPTDTKPNEALIEVLKKALNMAETGQLQSYIGTGFTRDGLRLATWCDTHDNVYEMLGSIEWLKAEFLKRRTEDFGT
jgi:hypothetical protein